MTRKIVVRAVRDVAGITIGCIVYALSFALFVVPLNLAPGGISGLAIILNHFFTIVPIGLTIIILNAPLFLLSLKRLGKGFLWRSIYATVASSLMIDLITPYMHDFHVDIVLSSIYAGVLMGIGIGIIFHFFGSTGGTDLLAQLLSEHIGLSFGTTLLLIDTVIIAFSGIAFHSVTIPLYSIVSLYISAKTIDLVQEGVSFSKAAWIISNEPDIIVDRIMTDLDRGATRVTATGGFTKEPREIVFCVVPQSQISHLKQIVHEIDPKAFVVIVEVTETFGLGFKELGTR
ncbi:MAG: YitT family protein [Candidatus Cryosericum sp.]|nr:YitT family protein [bacterium]